MRSLFFVACASSALCADGVAQTSLPERSIIELRVARTSPAPGYTQRRSVGDTSFFLSDAVLVSDSDIEDARAEPTEDAAKQTLLIIKLRLTAEAARRVAESTRAHVGDRVGVFLNQQLVAAPPIVGEVGSGAHLEIYVGPPAPLDQIAAAVAARWHTHH
jgi:preprotein translocase subunit SecD